VIKRLQLTKCFCESRARKSREGGQTKNSFAPQKEIKRRAERRKGMRPGELSRRAGCLSFNLFAFLAGDGTAIAVLLKLFAFVVKKT